MSGFVYYSDELLRPISPERPGGVDLRYEPVFGEISEARRSDDNLDIGAWAKEGGRKSAEWDRVAKLCLKALGEKTKDLRIACFLSEAAAELDGFSGLRDGFRLLTALIERFWDQGLYPAIDDGDLEYRASALGWLNDRMPDLAGRIIITNRSGAENYGYVRYLQAQQVGTEASVASGVSGEKRETIQGLIRQGWITMDTWKAALGATKRAALETIYQEFDEARQALRALEAISDQRFGAVAAPSFSASKEVFDGIDGVVRPELRKKQEEEAAAAAKSTPVPALVSSEGSGTAASGVPARIGLAPLSVADNAAWEQAEILIHTGRIDEGLNQMASLAAAESSGRARFMRKLALVDVCLSASRDRLARTVLEELNRQIDEFKLEQWESTGLVGAVWSRLYRLYRRSESSSDQDAATQLYNRLCRVDPWQAFLRCED
jgi:type VI secretion system protein ImpA